MKVTPILAATMIVLSSFAISDAAHASVVNFSGYNVNMGTVAIGQHGTISNFFKPLSGSEDQKTTEGVAFGNLPKMSRIDWTYTLSGTNKVSYELESYGSYNYTVKTTDKKHHTISTNYNGYSFYETNPTPDDGYSSTHVNVGFTNKKPSLMLVWAFAHLTMPTATTGNGNTWVQNNSSNLAYFSSEFEGVIKEIENKIESKEIPMKLTGTLTYRVSAIPLPPALSMFAALMLGMFGFTHFARQRKIAAVAA